MLTRLRAHLKGKVVILGVGNILRSDDGAGSILAKRIKDKVAFVVFDAGISPENYLGKIIAEEPDTIVVIDTADFGQAPGDFRVFEANDIKTANLFSTHNASVLLTINYLQSNLKADIIFLIIQPRAIILGDKLSPEVSRTVRMLEGWFYDGSGKEKG